MSVALHVKIHSIWPIVFLRGTYFEPLVFPAGPLLPIFT